MSGLKRIDYADRGTALTGWLARPAGVGRHDWQSWAAMLSLFDELLGE